MIGLGLLVAVFLILIAMSILDAIPEQREGEFKLPKIFIGMAGMVLSIVALLIIFFPSFLNLK